MDSDLYDIVITSTLRGNCEYYKKGTGILHRLNGPAVFLDGKKEYWVNGQQLSPQEVLLMEMIYGRNV